MAVTPSNSSDYWQLWRRFATLDVLAEPFFASCTTGYIDVGTNIGERLRELYGVWPAARRQRNRVPMFDQCFGAPSSNRRDDVCVLAFEPNPVHAENLSRLMQEIRGGTNRRLALVRAAVTSHNGVGEFWNDHAPNAHHWSASATGVTRTWQREPESVGVVRAPLTAGHEAAQGGHYMRSEGHPITSQRARISGPRCVGRTTWASPTACTCQL